MTFSEEDWEQEGDYARYVLRPPTPEDLRHKADLDRKRLKEEGPLSERDGGHTSAQAMAAKAPVENRPGTPTSDGAALAHRSLHVSRSESDRIMEIRRRNTEREAES